MLKAKGLYTFSNYLSGIPEGSLLDANNAIIDRDGVIEPRRGITQYGTIGSSPSNDTAKQLLLYKDRVLAHYDSVIAWDNGSGTFADFSASFVEVDTGLRIKYIEMNGNLFVTTSTGIRKVSASSAATLGSAIISDAGGIQALDLDLLLDLSTTNGFLGPAQEVAYRIVWGTRDLNNNLILGAPSYRAVIQNQSDDFRNVIVSFTVPDSIDTNYFYQVYRTSNATFGGSGDEMKLVYEDVYVSGSTITITDEQPEDLRDTGTPLYTNEFSGEGILQANNRPPVAKDVASYKSTAFYANTRGAHKADLTLLGLDGLVSLDVVSVVGTMPATVTTSTNHNLTTGDKIVLKGAGAADGTWEVTVTGLTTFEIDSPAATGTDVMNVYTSNVTITKGATVNTYYFVGRPEKTQVTYQTFAATTDGSYFLINSFDDRSKYFVWFDKTGSTLAPSGLDTAGRIGVRVDVSSGVVTAADMGDAVATALVATGDFYVSDYTTSHIISTSDSGFAADASPGLVSPFAAPTDITVVQQGFGEDSSNNYVRLSTLNSPASRIEDTAKSLVAVVNKNATEVVIGLYTPDTNALPGTMTFESKVIDTTVFTIQANSSVTGAMFNPNITSALTSQNEIHLNRIYFSKTQQPEAVPSTNNLDIGPKDKAILRIVGLRDSLFILKEEGIYRLTGENSTNFTVALFDNSSNITAPDTAAILNNQIYCLTSQGVATVSETGVSVISRPIENVFSRIASPNFTNYTTACFGVGYEADRSYLLWILDQTEDTKAQKAYRFNTFTQTWTYWTKEATSGVVNPKLNKLYVGAGDLNLVETERKNLNRTDYADRQYDLAITPNAIVDNTIELTSVASITPGDILVQTQYVTVAQVIRLARKFKLDPGVPNTISNDDKAFYQNFSIEPGDNLQTRVGELITQLNSDIGSAYSTVFSADFATFQTEFNALMTAFNLDTVLVHNNYQLSSNTVNYEVSILYKDQSSNTVTVSVMEPLIEGEITHYTAIESTIIWAPYTFGDVSMLKHVRSATLMFENAGIATATVGYNTDLSSNYEDIPFTMEGDGSWGVFYYSSTTWGGEGTARPFRTLIPRQKQRCRFIRSRYKHSAAYYKFSILGLSYTYEINSERAYR